MALENFFDESDELHHKKFFQELENTLEHHFSQCGKFDCGIMAHYLCYDQVHGIPEIWSVPKVQKNLEKVKFRLKEVATIFEELPWSVYDEMRLNALKRMELFTPPGENEPKEYYGEQLEKRKAMLNLAKRLIPYSPSYRAFSAFSEFFAVIDDFYPSIDAAMEKAEDGSPLGKKDIEAWRLVDSCAKMCEVRNPNTIPVPKHMNSAGPFYRLLADLFPLFGLETSPETAFRGWRKHVGNGDEK
ncbi:hypothetical protein [Pseudohalocynthiibacter sp. F2068]|jgi:hypothetical protein|uniref:hypothetical protein n=1 Tax=Pseudohalocynthiibacter sp. F2068 TaxID=2926418 RepID=UPI001FF50864|nr:hypothetical protein [Pseudohalocynthiibacter sp. F2068]MCK0104416.1 hypothetical protein [Pseudohalocynthiibacter sp. F2068]